MEKKSRSKEESEASFQALSSQMNDCFDQDSRSTKKEYKVRRKRFLKVYAEFIKLCREGYYPAIEFFFLNGEKIFDYKVKVKDSDFTSFCWQVAYQGDFLIVLNSKTYKLYKHKNKEYLQQLLHLARKGGEYDYVRLLDELEYRLSPNTIIFIKSKKEIEYLKQLQEECKQKLKEYKQAKAEIAKAKKEQRQAEGKEHKKYTKKIADALYNKQKYKELFNVCLLGYQQEDASAVEYLALIYSKGLGVPADADESEKWLKIGADKYGSYECKRQLAIRDYYKGFDPNTQYIFVYKKLSVFAVQGDSYCAYLAAELIFHGRGDLKPNLQAAMLFYQKAAEKDYGPALYKIGVMHYEGTYVEKDIAKAQEYLESAIENGCGEAREYLQKKEDEARKANEERRKSIESYWKQKKLKEENGRKERAKAEREAEREAEESAAPKESTSKDVQTKQDSKAESADATQNVVFGKLKRKVMLPNGFDRALFDGISDARQSNPNQHIIVLDFFRLKDCIDISAQGFVDTDAYKINFLKVPSRFRGEKRSEWSWFLTKAIGHLASSHEYLKSAYQNLSGNQMSIKEVLDGFYSRYQGNETKENLNRFQHQVFVASNQWSCLNDVTDTFGFVFFERMVKKLRKRPFAGKQKEAFRECEKYLHGCYNALSFVVLSFAHAYLPLDDGEDALSIDDLFRFDQPVWFSMKANNYYYGLLNYFVGEFGTQRSGQLASYIVLYEENQTDYDKLDQETYLPEFCDYSDLFPSSDFQRRFSKQLSDSLSHASAPVAFQLKFFINGRASDHKKYRFVESPIPPVKMESTLEDGKQYDFVDGRLKVSHSEITLKPDSKEIMKVSRFSTVFDNYLMTRNIKFGGNTCHIVDDEKYSSLKIIQEKGRYVLEYHFVIRVTNLSSYWSDKKYRGMTLFKLEEEIKEDNQIHDAFRNFYSYFLAIQKETNLVIYPTAWKYRYKIEFDNPIKNIVRTLETYQW